ncbi:MAG: hypothetical protein WCJ81_09195 [bacterium]
MSSFKCKNTLFNSVVLNFYSDGSTTDPQTVLTINHDYGFIPCILTMANYSWYGGSDDDWSPVESLRFSSPYVFIYASSNSSTMTIKFENYSVDPITVSNLTLKYYLFAHQGA